MEPATKKMKLEKEIENENIKRFLNEVVEHKTPVAAPHSKGSSSSEEQDVCVSAEVEERGKDHRETGSKEIVASPETNRNSRAGSSGNFIILSKQIK
jgi:GTP-dependent phosphoenolpyruvate carboxykinase